MPASVNQHEIISRIAKRLKEGSEMADEKPLLDVSVFDGNYRVIMPAEGGLHALRYGEYWQDLTGNNMVFALASELDDARKRIAELERQIEDAAEEHREREEKRE